MSNTIAIRMPDPLLKQVRRSAKAMKKSRSEVIREALEDYFARAGVGVERDPYAALLSLMPFEGSGIPDLASKSQEYLRKKFQKKSDERSRSH